MGKAVFWMKQFKLPRRLRNLLLVLAGNALYALAVDMFVLPCGLITGGTTGLALIGQHWLGISISTFVMIWNCSAGFPASET